LRPERPRHESTPVQEVAVVIGIGRSWVFFFERRVADYLELRQAPRSTQNIERCLKRIALTLLLGSCSHGHCKGRQIVGSQELDCCFWTL
jgi:hypothetical protein